MLFKKSIRQVAYSYVWTRYHVKINYYTGSDTGRRLCFPLLNIGGSLNQCSCCCYHEWRLLRSLNRGDICRIAECQSIVKTKQKKNARVTYLLSRFYVIYGGNGEVLFKTGHHTGDVLHFTIVYSSTVLPFLNHKTKRCYAFTVEI